MEAILFSEASKSRIQLGINHVKARNTTATNIKCKTCMLCGKIKFVTEMPIHESLLYTIRVNCVLIFTKTQIAYSI
jgi:hypothetical protein